MKMLSLASLCLLLAACATSIETVQHGTVKYLFTQTQNQWAENVILVSPCESELVGGSCKPTGETKVLVVSGKLPAVVGGVGQSMTTLGAAAIVRDGLVKSKSSVKQSNTTDVRASTVNPK
jgi:hypothetical protein